MIVTLDQRLFQLLLGRQHATLTAAMLALSLVGGGWGLLFLAPLLAHARTRRFGAWLIATLLVGALVAAALKTVVRRRRPFLVVAGLRAIALDSPTDYSFPSGHATGAFCFALFVSQVLVTRRPSRRTRLASAAALAFASAVALSRVVLGFHFPVDVGAGALLGSLIGTVGARAYLRVRAAREAAIARDFAPVPALAAPAPAASEEVAD